jgi:hypothetical protein
MKAIGNMQNSYTNTLMKPKSNILICTSVMQVINYKCLLEKNNLEKNYNNYVVLIHPVLNSNSKKMISYYCKKFNLMEMIDCTDKGKEISDIIEQFSFKNFSFRNIHKKYKKYFSDIDIIEKNIQTFFFEKIGSINSITVRESFKKLDSYFINPISNDSIIYTIKDGVGDYIPIYWFIYRLNFYDFKHYLKSQILNLFFSFIISITLRKNLSKYFFYKKYKIHSDYCNIGLKNSISIKDLFKKNVIKLYHQNNYLNKIHVIMLGSMMGWRNDIYNSVDVDEKIKIYKFLIEQIKKNQNIDNKNIWYKHHPRLPKEIWLKLKDNLDCSFFDYNHQNLSEIELANKDLMAVYSVSSTSLFYAKMIFNINSYTLNIKSIKTHPSAFDKSNYLYKKYFFNEIIYK